MVDHRTTDGTIKAIEEILRGKKQFHIEPYEFDGFGPARTASLKKAWEKYSNATHVWIADPDWKPDMSTINKSDLTLDADAFRFLVYDRNGNTARRGIWLLLHRQGITMQYNLHEIVNANIASIKNTEWVVYEIEQKGSWHTRVGHSFSGASKRFLFDLKYLEKDLIEYGWDAHTHYHLGVTHLAYVEAVLHEKKMMEAEDSDSYDSLDAGLLHHFHEARKYLKLRATARYNIESIEDRWKAMYWLGMLHSLFLKPVKECCLVSYVDIFPIALQFCGVRKMVLLMQRL
jgi:hypothetical protein